MVWVSRKEHGQKLGVEPGSCPFLTDFLTLLPLSWTKRKRGKTLWRLLKSRVQRAVIQSKTFSALPNSHKIMAKLKKLNPTPDYTRVVQNRFDIWWFAVLDFSPGSTKAHENMTSISPHIHMLSLNMRVILQAVCSRLSIINWAENYNNERYQAVINYILQEQD